MTNIMIYMINNRELALAELNYHYNGCTQE